MDRGDSQTLHVLKARILDETENVCVAALDHGHGTNSSDGKTGLVCHWHGMVRGQETIYFHGPH